MQITTIQGTIQNLRTSNGNNPKLYASISTEGATFSVQTDVRPDVGKRYDLEVQLLPETLVRTYQGEHSAQTYFRPFKILKATPVSPK